MPKDRIQDSRSAFHKKRRSSERKLYVLFGISVAAALFFVIAWGIADKEWSFPLEFVGNDRSAVQAWLGRKYSGADCKILQWYPAVSARGCKKFPLIPGSHEITRWHEPYWGGVDADRVMRVKFSVGDLLVMDWVFLLDSQGVKDHVDTSDFRFAGETLEDYDDRLKRAL